MQTNQQRSVILLMPFQRLKYALHGDHFDYFQEANVMFVDVNNEDDDNTDNFVCENANTLDDSNSSDLEDVPLADRLRKKTKLTKKPASDVKRTRGRQRRNLLKVPPLKIKAIMTKKATKESDDSNEELNVTKYKIHENTSSKPLKSSQFTSSGNWIACVIFEFSKIWIVTESESVDSSKSADEENENDCSPEECAPDNEESPEKSPKKNPFPIFE